MTMILYLVLLGMNLVNGENIDNNLLPIMNMVSGIMIKWWSSHNSEYG